MRVIQVHGDVLLLVLLVLLVLGITLGQRLGWLIPPITLQGITAAIKRGGGCSWGG